MFPKMLFAGGAAPVKLMDGALVAWPPKMPEDPALVVGAWGCEEPAPKTNGAPEADGAGAEDPEPPAVKLKVPGVDEEPPPPAPKVNDDGADALPDGWELPAEANGLFGTEPAENVKDALEPDPN